MYDKNRNKCLSVGQLRGLLEALDTDWLLTPNMVGNMLVYKPTEEGYDDPEGYIDFQFDGEFESFRELKE